eukprot:TRINITY_DN10991_c0_g1_i10.p2 TRINITY_DN10991_c0_g1~~TRINITY_DN10991_c0_g1_i10.p2  ORF type:complete len:198 (+),score=-6.07 TRINITY_DN10991_c0_g1_i10:466-1059(+)
MLFSSTPATKYRGNISVMRIDRGIFVICFSIFRNKQGCNSGQKLQKSCLRINYLWYQSSKQNMQNSYQFEVMQIILIFSNNSMPSNLQSKIQHEYHLCNYYADVVLPLYNTTKQGMLLLACIQQQIIQLLLALNMLTNSKIYYQIKEHITRSRVMRNKKYVFCTMHFFLFKLYTCNTNFRDTVFVYTPFNPTNMRNV